MESYGPSQNCYSQCNLDSFAKFSKKNSMNSFENNSAFNIIHSWLEYLYEIKYRKGSGESNLNRDADFKVNGESPSSDEGENCGFIVTQ